MLLRIDLAVKLIKWVKKLIKLWLTLRNSKETLRLHKKELLLMLQYRKLVIYKRMPEIREFMKIV